jgi:hypothetical protein
MVLLGALPGALAASPISQARSVSRYCSLLSAKEIGRPLRVGHVRTTSVTLAYPSVAKADKGRITLCSHEVPSDLIAQTSVARFTSVAGAKNGGPWADAYSLGRDGFVVLKRKYMFHIQYASGAPGFSNTTAKTLSGTRREGRKQALKRTPSGWSPLRQRQKHE